MVILTFRQVLCRGSPPLYCIGGWADLGTGLNPVEGREVLPVPGVELRLQVNAGLKPHLLNPFSFIVISPTLNDTCS